ncbi:MAG: hypothetical protein WC781_05700 [Candidatus Pacearchaeota archaeon]|jgi:hypothetical protein
MKYQVIWKFSDVITEIEAESLEEAIETAENSDAPKEDTYCYGTEVEEIK